MDTATLSVLVAGVVGALGILSPLITSRMNAAERRADRHEARMIDTREVIDAASIALATAYFLTPSEKRHYTHHLRDTYTKLNAAVIEASVQSNRLAVRLGESDHVVLGAWVSNGGRGRRPTGLRRCGRPRGGGSYDVGGSGSVGRG